MLLLFGGILSLFCVIPNENAISLKKKLVNDTIVFSEGGIREIDWKELPFTPFFHGLKNDTIFSVGVYPRTDSIKDNDSLVIEHIFVHTGERNFWICRHFSDGGTRICKFKKCRHPSELFLKANRDSFWEAEMEMGSYKQYNKDGVLIEEDIRIGNMSIHKIYKH